MFGSFWGAKVIVILSALVGFLAITRIVKLISPMMEYQTRNLVALTLTFSNYFLWHLHHGHLTFSTIYWAFPILYIILKSLNGKVTLKELAIVSFSLFIVCMGGFYPAIVYFLIPLYISYTFYGIIFRLKNFKANKLFWRNFLFVVIANLVGIILASYKIYQVLWYQGLYPRTVNSIEIMNLYHWAVAIFIPSNSYEFIIGKISGPWTIWEYSAYSVLFLVIFPLILFKPRLIKSIKFNEPQKFLLVMTFAGIILFLGSFHIWSPFMLLNKFLFKNSVRVTGRYLILSLAGIHLSALPVLESFIQQKQNVWKINLAITILLILNFFTFFPSLNYFYNHVDVISSINKIEVEPIYNMNIVKFAKDRDNYSSSMYREVLKGYSVPNCYQPMNREIVFAEEIMGKRMDKTKTLHFLENSSHNLSMDCIKESYFTASLIIISDKCPSSTCVNLNAKNVYEVDPKLVFNLEKRKYCSK